MVELLAQHEPDIKALRLIPSEGGVFEVKVGGDLLYSKLQTGRHAHEGEVMQFVKKKLRG